MAITAAQCRAARSILDWSQSKLAEAATVSRATIADFERGTREPHPNNMTAIQSALETAGVLFIPENGGGAGVRMRDRE